MSEVWNHDPLFTACVQLCWRGGIKGGERKSNQKNTINPRKVAQVGYCVRSTWVLTHVVTASPRYTNGRNF